MYVYSYYYASTRLCQGSGWKLFFYCSNIFIRSANGEAAAAAFFSASS